MHAECFDWVQNWAPAGRLAVLDVGGRNVNGSPRELFHEATEYHVVDLIEAPEVTWAGDFLRYSPKQVYGAVLHLEVAEHTPDWPAHLAHAADLLALDGSLIFTAAGPNRAAHSAHDGGPLRPGEHYENVHPDLLRQVLGEHFGWAYVNTTPDGADVRAVARR